MITLNVNLKKSGDKYEAEFVADENGKPLFREDWGMVLSSKVKVSRRLKAFQLDGKSIAIALNVINPTLDKPSKESKKTKGK